jgi:hypothetical protein
VAHSSERQRQRYLLARNLRSPGPRPSPWPVHMAGVNSVTSWRPAAGSGAAVGCSLVGIGSLTNGVLAPLGSSCRALISVLTLVFVARTYSSATASRRSDLCAHAASRRSASACTRLHAGVTSALTRLQARATSAPTRLHAGVTAALTRLHAGANFSRARLRVGATPRSHGITPELLLGCVASRGANSALARLDA